MARLINKFMTTIKPLFSGFFVPYVTHVAAWMSQGANVILLFGHEDQTISARAYENRFDPVWGPAYRLINLVFFWQDNHCKTSYDRDIARAIEIGSKLGSHHV